MSEDAIKKIVGEKAASLIEPGMLVGLGSGSTTTFFIKRLIERCRDGLQIEAVASSSHSFQLAKKGGISLREIDEVSFLDITVDGADEIDSQKRMIKGGGGAHVREKILATMSREMVVIVDETKLVKALGKVKLPIEVLPFGKMGTLRHIQKLGYPADFRYTFPNVPFLSDNGNFIIDLHFPKLRESPEQDHANLIQIPGVVDTGFFFNLAGRVIVGFADGQVTMH